MYRLRSPISPKIHSCAFPHAFPFTHSPTQARSPRIHRWAQADAHKAASLYLLAPSLPIAFPLFRAQSEGRSYAPLVPQKESQEAAASSSRAWPGHLWFMPVGSGQGPGEPRWLQVAGTEPPCSACLGPGHWVSRESPASLPNTAW